MSPSEQPAVHDLTRAGKSQMESPGVNGHMLWWKDGAHVQADITSSCDSKGRGGRRVRMGHPDIRAGGTQGGDPGSLAEQGCMQKLCIIHNDAIYVLIYNTINV